MDKVRILIVEDEIIVARHMERELVNINYEVVDHAVTGEDAIEKAKKHRPDIVLMDIKLDGDMDGIEAAEEILELLDIPVLYLTAFAGEETLHRAKLTRPFGYILKPYNIDQLNSNIQMALYKHGMDQKMRHLNSVLAAIRNVNQTIVKERNPQKLIQKICNNLTETRGFYTSQIVLMDGAFGRIVSWAESGLACEMEEFIQMLERGDYPYCFREAIASSKVIVIERPVEDCLTCPLCYLYEGKQKMAVRIEHDDKLYGVLTVSLPEWIPTNEEEKGLLYEVAGDIAFALHDIALEKSRKKIEKKLALQNKALESSISGFIISDLDGRITYANPAFLRMWEYDDKLDVIGELGTKFWYVDDTISEVLQIIQDDGTWVGELTAKKKDGSEFFVQMMSSVVHEDSGSPKYLMGSFIDITQRKKAQEEVSRLASVVQQAQETIVITDINGNIIFANHFFEKLTGYKLSEVLGHNPRVLKSGFHDNDFYKELWETILAGKAWHGTFMNKRKDGSIYHEEATIFPIKDSGEKIINFAAVKRDVTGQREIEAALRASEKVYRGLIEALPEAIFVEQEGKIVFMNQPGLALLGYESLTELHGKDLPDLFTDAFEDESDNIEIDLEENHTPPLLGGKLIKKNGDAIDVDIAFIDTIYNDKPAILCAAMDITEIEALREKAHKIRHLATLGELSATIAHEVRNPLASISLDLEYLEDKLADHDNVRKTYDRISSCIIRIQDVVSGILDFARPTPPVLKKHDIHEVLETAISSVELNLIEDGIDVIREFCYVQQEVLIDPNQIVNVFVNFITNAQQAMTPGGVLLISTICHKKIVEVRFADTGEGIDSDDIVRIFDPFFTTKTEGTGLGLAVSTRILEQHNVKVSVESQLGEGTTFILEFPLFNARF